MRIPKKYGQSRKDACPFCGQDSTTKNSQGVPTCFRHRNKSLDVKCACGNWLDVRAGKFGAYFFCIRCGNISFSKGMENYQDTQRELEKKRLSVEENKNEEPKKKEYKPKEIFTTSDEVDFL